MRYQVNSEVKGEWNWVWSRPLSCRTEKDGGMASERKRITEGVLSPSSSYRYGKPVRSVQGR